MIVRRNMAVAAAIALVAAGCTGGGAGPRRDGSPGSSPVESSGGRVLRVIASATGPTAQEDQTYVEGMLLAAEELFDETELGLRVDDDGGDGATARRLLAEALQDPDAIAVLVVGSGSPISALRPDVERAGKPVFLLGGDLYTGRALYRQVFQTGVPLRWQGEILARYLVHDRGHRRVLLVTEEGSGGRVARESFRAAVAREGSGVAASVTVGSDGDLPAVGREAGRADAVVYLGGVAAGRRTAAAVAALDDPPQFAGSSEILHRSFARGVRLPPGTVGCTAYTWAAWAEPIPRVAAFRARMQDRFGHLPHGFEQEGYDAVAILGAGLERSGGRGGDGLVRALEAFRRRTFSALPIHLRPDDHVVADQHQLGLFTVAGPRDPDERWAPAWARWTPLMRTFTGLGDRTNILDRDKPEFFPRWRPPRPGPFYWESRHGIVTRPDEDRLH